jgi:hypothetical protein
MQKRAYMADGIATPSASTTQAPLKTSPVAKESRPKRSPGQWAPWIDDPDPPEEHDLERFSEGLRKYAAERERKAAKKD